MASFLSVCMFPGSHTFQDRTTTSQKTKFWGRIFLGNEEPTRRDIPDRGPGLGTSRTKTLCNSPFPVVSDREWPGYPAIWVGTSRDQKNFMRENFGLNFRFPLLLSELPSGAPGLHALLNYFGINFRFEYIYTYTLNCFGN